MRVQKKIRVIRAEKISKWVKIFATEGEEDVEETF